MQGCVLRPPCAAHAEAAAIHGDDRRAFPQLNPCMVGLGGVEPPTSSLSAIEGSPLCNPAFLQVVRDRRGRSNALFERVAEGRLRSARRFSRRARTLPVTRQSSLSRCRLTCTEPPSA